MSKKDSCFVGIDTSNYTTSAAVVTTPGEVIANLKRPLPVKAGECGLRQSDAVFAHVKNLPDLMAELERVTEGYEVLAVGYSATPRTADGSYMPCFLTGRAAAETYATALHIPTFSCSHQDGHLMAALYSSKHAAELMEKPFAAFHVSGGTTEMLRVDPTDGRFAVTLVGETADLNAGQAIDRIGVMMGLEFPCGKELEKLSDGFLGKTPKPKISVKDGICHLSGLENLAQKLWRETEDRAAVARYALTFVGETLRAMTRDLDAQYPNIPVVYAGGVMSNRYLQAMLGTRKNTYFAEPQFSADNAAGVALLCRRSYLKKN